MKVEKLKIEDLTGLMARCSGLMPGLAENPDYPKFLSAFEAYSFFVNERVVCCGGFVEVWPGRLQGWSIIADDIGPFGMLALTKAWRRILATMKSVRIELTVQAEFEAGKRWAKMLGFIQETPNPMMGYLPNGGAAVLYAMVK